MLSLYRGFSAVAAPLIDALLARRLASGKEDRRRIDERFGKAGRARPEGALVWVHAASVGESLSVLSLISRLLEENPALHVLVTTGTVTSAALMAERLPARAFHQFAPVDRLDCVRSFLDHWRPDLALWIESEFWPNLLMETHGRGTKLVLINARISPRAFARWRLMPALIRPMLNAFDLCLAQSEYETARLRKLGAPVVRAPGNLKFAAVPLPAKTEELARLRAETGTRPRWLAASTHPGEEETVALVHAQLVARFSRLLTVIVPRHPGRGPAIAEMLRARGLKIARRSAGEAIGAGTDIYVADSMGELGLFYRLCPIAFVGGSLVPHGGHNPIEPAQLGCAVIHGPSMTNFQEIIEELATANGAVAVNGAAQLCSALSHLLSDAAETRRLAEAAKRVADGKAQVLDRVMAELAPFVAAIPQRAPCHAHT
jgi:3-deoxy-D-manno-octulosonic-acid transferase